MSKQSNVELYAFEIGSMSLNGSVADHGDGRCSVSADFTDNATTNNQRFEFRFVARKTLAALARAFADNLGPVHSGAYTFWCEQHVTELEGQPSWRHDEITNTWSLDLAEMECPHSHSSGCRSSWRSGQVAVHDLQEAKKQ